MHPRIISEGANTVSIIVNIEWNDYGWTRPQIPVKPSFGYAKNGNMPHDTLNFLFDKPVDSKDRIYGYFQISGRPRNFASSETNKMIFFYSKGKIVGFYGEAVIRKEQLLGYALPPHGIGVVFTHHKNFIGCNYTPN